MSVDRERLARVLLSVVKAGGDWQAGAEAVVADIAAQGYAIVPVVPTPGMIDRFVSRALCVSVHGDGGWSNYAREQWATMLTAAQGDAE